MKKIGTIIGLLLVSWNISFGQTQAFQIRGVVQDTSGQILVAASVMLLEPSDSSLIQFTRADDQGRFQLVKLQSKPYLIKISYVGYLPLMVFIEPQNQSMKDLGILKMTEISKELFEVVIKTAKAPMTIRGDTIEYDATKFKVPEGSTVEDLLRRLPGIEVTADGTISTEGQEIRKVTVDGRRFFGGDPKSATKNLPAEGISKVQLYTDDNEEKKLTGVSSAPPEKMMNLKLKDEFKKGSFGKIIAAAGTRERAELKGNINRFNESQQLSIIGSLNNTGRNGLSWDDYQDFRGSQSFNWNDETDFGFGGGGDQYIYYFEDDGGLQANFFGGRQSGLPLNGSGGINYSRFNKDWDANAVYFFNYNDLYAQATRNQQNFLPDRYYENQDTSTRQSINRGQQAQLRTEIKFDSMNTLVINGSGRISNRKLFNYGSYRYLRENDQLSNYTEYDNYGNTDQSNGNASVIYRKKYKNIGRSSGFSAGVIFNTSQAENHLFSENEFYNTNGTLDSLTTINQQNSTDNNSVILKSSLLHVEPINKRIFIQSFYNFSRRLESSDRDVFDVSGEQLFQNGYLSRYYDNTIQLHRLGSSVRYTHQGINISVGLARQFFDLSGNFTGGIVAQVDRQYYNWIPNFNFNHNAKKNQNINLNYNLVAREPRITDLQPIVDNSNPLFIRIGNPDLIPQLEHRMNVGFRKNNPVKFTNFNISLNFNLTENQIIQNQQVDSNFITTSQPMNYKGSRNAGVWAGYGFPIIKTKLTTNFNLNSSVTASYALVNAIENETFSINNGIQIRMNITPNENISAFLSARVSQTQTEYSLNSSQDQTLYNENYSINVNSKLFWGLFVSANLNYDRYTNDRFGFQQDVPILNASIYKVLFKNKRAEIRLSVYDILNKNLGVNLNAFGNTVSETRTTTLRRYGLLSFTYNIKGIDTRVNRQNQFYY